jgi:PhnB protein
LLRSAAVQRADLHLLSLDHAPQADQDSPRDSKPPMRLPESAEPQAPLGLSIRGPRVRRGGGGTRAPSVQRQENHMPMLDSYLFFNGTCAEAMRFYQRTLGGEIQAMMTYAQSPEPPQCGPGDADRIMHACLILDGRLLMASDAPQDQPVPPMGAISLALNYPTAAEARRIFDALADGGKVVMPMGKTFWAEAFGMLTDKYGVPWMVGGGAQQQV